MSKKIIALMLSLIMVFSSFSTLNALSAPEIDPNDPNALFTYMLQEYRQQAMDNLEAIGEVSGLIGFDEFAIDFDSNTQTPVIVMLRNQPAPVARALQGTPFGGSGSSHANLEALAANDKAVFHQGLNTMFGDVSYGMGAAQYAINFDFDVAINGVAMHLPADRIEELLEIESVAAVFYNAPLHLPEVIVEDIFFDMDGVIAGAAGSLNKISNMAMQIPQAHALGYRGANVIVGVIDTGIDYLHPDLREAFFWFERPDCPTVPEFWRGKLLEVDPGFGVMVDGEEWRFAYFGFNGFDAQFYPYTLTPHTSPGVARSMWDPHETTHFDWYDAGYPPQIHAGRGFRNNHGTHVAGIIVGRGANQAPGYGANPQPPRNVVGVAPEARLISYRLGGPGGGSNIAAAIMCLEVGVMDGVDIFNFSYGDGYARGPFTAMALAINYITIAYNIIFVHSAGNSGPTAFTVGGPDGSPLSYEVGSNMYNGINVVMNVGGSNFTGNLIRSDISTGFEPQLNTVTGTIDNWLLTGGAGVVPMSINEDNSHNFFIMPQREGGPGFNGIGSGAAADWTPEVIEQAGGKIVVVAGVGAFANAVPQNARTHGAAGIIHINPSGTANQVINWGNNNNNMLAALVPTISLSYAEGNAFAAALRANDMEAFLIDFNGTGRGQISNFSSRGPIVGTFDIKPEIITPGSNILSTVPWEQGVSTALTPAGSEAREARRARTPAHYTQYGYASMSGTSMSAPFTAGLLALIWGQHLTEVYEAMEARGETITPLGGQPNPHKTMSAFEVRARLSNTATLDFYEIPNFSVHEVGAGSPNVINAIRFNSYFTVSRDVFVPIYSEDTESITIPNLNLGLPYRFFEHRWTTMPAEVTTFSFGAGNVGMPDAQPRVMTANLYNTSNVARTYDIFFEWNLTQNNASQQVRSNGNVPLFINGDRLNDTITVPANSRGNFTVSMQVPATLTADDIGSHEGFIIVVDQANGERMHLPFAMTILNTAPQWYIDGAQSREFEIRTPAQLDELAQIVDGRFGFVDSFKGARVTLMNDLNLASPTVLSNVVIGTKDLPFEGHFDGQGHLILIPSLAALHTSAIPIYRALFGQVRNAVIENVVVDTINHGAINTDALHVSQFSAGIVGHAVTTEGQTTIIRNNVNNMDITATGMQGRSMQIGGIVGYAETEVNGTIIIENNINNGNITGSTFIGGILGATAMAPKPDFDATLIGPTEGTVILRNNVNNGTIHVTIDLARAGGIAGYLESTAPGSIIIENNTNQGLVHFWNRFTSPTHDTAFIHPGYGSYSPERRFFNALGGIVGFAIGVEMRGNENFGDVRNALPVLMMRTMGDGRPMWPSDDIDVNLKSGGIVGYAVNSIITGNLNSALTYYIEIEPEMHQQRREVNMLIGGIAAFAAGETETFENLNKGDALAAIVQVENLNQGDFVPATWAQVLRMLASLRAFIIDPNITQIQIDEAVGRLHDAINDLEEPQLPELPITDDLIAAIEEAESLNQGDYTPQSWMQVMRMIASARAILLNPHITQAGIDEAANRLWDAIDDLVIRP